MALPTALPGAGRPLAVAALPALPTRTPDERCARRLRRLMAMPRLHRRGYRRAARQGDRPLAEYHLARWREAARRLRAALERFGVEAAHG